MTGPRQALISALLAYVARLRFPTLLGVTVFLFVADLLIPDAIPFVDEILLGLAAAVVAGLRKRREGSEDAPREEIDVTPPRSG